MAPAFICPYFAKALKGLQVSGMNGPNKGDSRSRILYCGLSVRIPPPILNSVPRTPPVRSINDGDVYNPQRVSEWVTKWNSSSAGVVALFKSHVDFSITHNPVSGCQVYGGVVD